MWDQLQAKAAPRAAAPETREHGTVAPMTDLELWFKEIGWLDAVWTVVNWFGFL